MRIDRDRPIIEAGDHPATVEAALDWALRQPVEGLTEDRAWLRMKQLEEARDAIRDGFATFGEGEMLKPDGHAQLFLSVAGLESALSGYRAAVVASPEHDELKIAQVDELLSKITAKNT